MSKINSRLKKCMKILMIVSIGDADYFYLGEKSSCFVLLIYFFQILSYILNNHINARADYSFMSFIVNIIQIFNPSISLIGSQDDGLVGFGIFFLLVYIFIIVFILSISQLSREKLKHQMAKNNILRILLYLLYCFFTLLNFVIYLPVLNLFLGLSICGKRSLLPNLRQPNCTTNYGYSVIFSIGAIMTVGMNLISKFFFVEVHFLEKNLLKRRFRGLSILETSLLSLLNLLWIYELEDYVIQIVVITISVVLLQELYRNFTFKSHTLTKFYSFFYFNILTISIMMLIRYFSDKEKRDQNFLFNFLILFPIFGGISVRITKLYIQGIKKISGDDISIYGNNLDLYLEELLSSAKSSSKNEAIRYHLVGLLKEHQRECKNPLCEFKLAYERKYHDSKNKIIIDEFVKIMNNFFNVYLQCKFIRYHSNEKENLILKYFSFLSVEFGNPIYAYSMVLTNLRLRTNSSQSNDQYFFKLRSKVILQHIEDLVIIASNLSSSVIKRGAIMSLNEFSMTSYNLYKTYIHFDNFKLESIQMMSEILSLKIDYWQNMLEGFSSMEKFQDTCFILSSKIEHFNNFLKKKSLFLETFLTDSIVLNKIRSMSQSFIFNDLEKAVELDSKISESAKQTKELSLTDYDILNSNSAVLFVSLLDEGNCVGNISQNASKFFGFSNVQEFKTNGNIHNLMTRRFAELHHDFLKKVLHYGEITFFGFPRDVVCKDKDNFIFNAQAFVQFYFGISNEFTISAIFLKTLTPTLMFFTDETGRIDGISRSKIPEIRIKQEDLDFIYSNYNLIHLLPGIFDEDSIEDLDDKKIGRKTIFTNKPLCMYIPKDFKSFFKGSKSLLESTQNFKTRVIKDFNGKSVATGYLSAKSVSMANSECRYNVKTAILKALKEGFMTKFDVFVNLVMFAFKKTTGEKVNFYLLNVNEIKLSENQNADEIELFPISKTNSARSKISERTPKQEIMNEKPTFKNEIFDNHFPQNESQKFVNFETFESNLQTMQNEKALLYEEPIASKIKSVMKQTNSDDKLSSISSKANKLDDHDKKSFGGVSNRSKRELIHDSENDNENNFAHKATSIGSKNSNLSTTAFMCIRNITQSNSTPKMLKQLALIFIFQIILFLIINILYLILINQRIDGFLEKIINSVQPSILLESHSMALSSGFPQFLENEKFISNNTQLQGQILNQSRILNKYSKSEISNFYNELINSNQVNYFMDSITYVLPTVLSSSSVQNSKLQFYKSLSDKIDKQIEIFGDLNYNFISENYASSINSTSNILHFNQQQAIIEQESVVTFLIILSVIGLVFGIFFQLMAYPILSKYLIYSEKILTFISRISEVEALSELNFLIHCKNYVDSPTEEYLRKDFKSLLLNKKVRTTMMKTTVTKRNLQSTTSSTYLSSRFGSQKLSFKIYAMILILSISLLIAYYSIFLGLSEFLKSSLKNSLNLNIEFQKIEKASSTITLSTYMAIMQQAYFHSSNEALNSLINESYQYLSSFNPSKFLQFSSLTNGQLNYIQELMKNDLCIMFALEMCDKLENNVFSKGLQGYLSSQVLFVNYYRDLLQKNQINQNNVQYILSESQIIEFQKTRIAYYRLYEKVQNDLYLFSKDIITNLNLDLLLCYLIGGIIVILVLSFMLTKIYQKIRKNYFLLRNLVMIIPYNKLSEDTTIHLLKNLQ